MNMSSSDELYTVDEIINCMEEYYGPECVSKIRSVGIVPPNESSEVLSDADSDLSDDQVTGNESHLPGRILRAQAVVEFEEDEVYSKQPSTSTPSTHQEPQTPSISLTEKCKKRKVSKSVWSKSTNNNWSLPELNNTYGPHSVDFLKNNINSPFEAFRYFFNDSLIIHIVEQTNIYAGQLGNHSFNVDFDEIMVFIGILLLSGYHKLPSKRMYWQGEPDCQVPVVVDAMRRKRFEDILRFIHLNDNSKIDTDKFYKIRPLFQYLNNSFKSLPPMCNVCVDESIIPYYGRHSAKQFIRGKPIRFGFKLWVMSNPNGYILHAEPYCGISTALPTTGLGQGGDVVIGLVNHVMLPEGSKIYFDNLFTSVGLLEELSRMNLGGTGTLRENRVSASMALPSKKVFEKEKRGEFTVTRNGQLTAIRWNDNATVTLLSNCDDIQPLKTVQRFSRKEKKKIFVQMPNAIAKYNENMGGVDLNDQFLEEYRTSIRSKKWWWPFFRWAIDESCIQGWLMYRSLGHDVPLLQFRRQVVLQILGGFGKGRSRPGPSPSLSHSQALEDIRRDRKDHIIVKGESKYRRCKTCQGRTNFLCDKCKVPLHPDCFKSFHQ